MGWADKMEPNARDRAERLATTPNRKTQVKERAGGVPVKDLRCVVSPHTTEL
jgi:hypothetical protein